MAIHFPEGAYPHMEVDQVTKREVLAQAYPALHEIFKVHAEPVKLPSNLRLLRRTAIDIDWREAICFIDIERPNHKPKVMIPSIERARITVGDKPEMRLQMEEMVDLPTGMFLRFLTGYPDGTRAETAFILNYFSALMYKRHGLEEEYLVQKGFEGAALFELPKHMDIARRAFQAKTEGKILRVNYQEFFK